MQILDVTIYYDYIVRIGEKIKLLFLNQFLRESRNKIISKYTKTKPYLFLHLMLKIS